MWVITENGFIAICEDRDDPNSLLVRARTEADLECIRDFVPDDMDLWKPWHDSTADYQWRIRLPRTIVEAAMVLMVRNIDYDTLKARVHDNGDQNDPRSQDYYKVLVNVWEELKGIENYEIARKVEAELRSPRARKKKSKKVLHPFWTS